MSGADYTLTTVNRKALCISPAGAFAISPDINVRSGQMQVHQIINSPKYGGPGSPPPAARNHSDDRYCFLIYIKFTS